jgi:hypothetical protein
MCKQQCWLQRGAMYGETSLGMEHAEQGSWRFLGSTTCSRLGVRADKPDQGAR